ncbi:MAG: flagellar hook-basal body complex protein FliE [Pseudomonadales bacterium]|nr:flagellar hook-basal body complex protein FliE [Pseudomonadales bacterium]
MTDRVDINQVLMQMRELKSQVQEVPVRPATLENPSLRPDMINPGTEAGKPVFSDLLKQAVNSVNETQQQANALQTAYELGDQSVDITQVMIQMQKASVSFEAMTQVRNRLVSAYQDIMNMPI